MAVQVQLSSLWLPSSTVSVPFVHCQSKTKPSTTTTSLAATAASSLSSSAPIIQIVGGKQSSWHENSNSNGSIQAYEEECDWADLDADLYYWTKPLRPVQWYPGHIAKTEKELKDQLKLMDVVIEVRDARIPLSTTHPQMDQWLGNRKRILVLNREDMISTADRNAWATYFANQGTKVVFSNGQLGMGTMKLSRLAKALAAGVNVKRRAKGLLPRANAVFCLYMACGVWAACFLEGYFWTRTGERQATRMRARYLKAVLRQDVGYFDLHVTSTTEVITSVSNDTLVIQDIISEKIPNFLKNAATFFGCYLGAFLMLWRLAIVVFPFVILLIIPGLVYGRTLMVLARKMRDEYNKAGTIAEQAISSIRTVYAFVGETKTINEFSSALQCSVKLGLKQGLARGLAIGSNGITFAIWAFMAYYGSRLAMYHGAQGGTIHAVGASITYGGLALGAGLPNLKFFSEAMSAGDRIMEMIKRVPKIDSENMEGEILENVLGEVEFKHVEFAYPSRPETIIFKDFCLVIPAGKTVALVGSSGSGKSTVVSLLQRFYDPLGGEIILDRVAIDKLQLKWLRSQMGLVSQEPALFATTIKENILFGKEDATMEEVIEAAKASNAHNFICQLPQQYDTQVGERGVQMSGGQKTQE